MGEPNSDQLILEPGEGPSVQTGGLGVRFMISAEETDGRFSLVEYPLEGRSLGSPIHTHSQEDEYSYVLEGEVGRPSGYSGCGRPIWPLSRSGPKPQLGVGDEAV